MSFNDYLQQLYTRWWFSGLVLPIALSATVGVVLSIYTSWVVSRAILFQQEIQRAKEEILNYLDKFGNALNQESRTEVERLCVWSLISPGSALVGLQQYAAARRLQAISLRLEKETLLSWERMQAEPEETSRAAIAVAELDRFDPIHMRLYHRAGRIRPSWLRIAGLTWFVAALWRVRRIRVQFRRLSRYLKGEHDHW